MRHTSRPSHSERGMSMWPFVICLVLLLIFVFLWWSEKDNAETEAGKVATLQKEKEAINVNLGAYQKYVTEITLAVGYRGTEKFGDESREATVIESLKKDIDPAGTGGVKKAIDSLTVNTVSNLFTIKAGPGAPTSGPS